MTVFHTLLFSGVPAFPRSTCSCLICACSSRWVFVRACGALWHKITCRTWRFNCSWLALLLGSFFRSRQDFDQSIVIFRLDLKPGDIVVESGTGSGVMSTVSAPRIDGGKICPVIVAIKLRSAVCGCERANRINLPPGVGVHSTRNGAFVASQVVFIPA